MALDLSGFAGAAKSEPTAIPDTFTAIVVRADESGLWVAPVGDDRRHPVGPCKGGWTPNGTRVPPGALVMLTHTAEGPWVVGVDNPALAISDSTLAPFANASFEQLPPPGYNFVVNSWNDYWSAARRGDAPAANTYTPTLEEGAASHGLRCLRIEARGTYALISPDQAWNVPPGSSLEVTFYARATGPAPDIQTMLYSYAGTGNPGPFVSGATVITAVIKVSAEWMRYRATFTIPTGHTRVLPHWRLGAGAGTEATVWFDNVGVDLVTLDPAAAHQDYLRRATAVLAGGGHRTVTAGGNVDWSQPLTIAAAGVAATVAPNGRFEIAMPANGVVIPVHHSTARTSVTVTGGAVLLNANEALWYELPIGQVAASQSARFHVLASDLGDGYVVPAHWILVVRRAAWSSTAHAPEYVWGDGQPQDPWRTPSLNGGWAAGTSAPRFTKGAGSVVRLAGRVKNGVGSAFTLPAGYRPGVQHEAYVRDGAGTAALITVTTAGVVTTAGNNTDHSIATSFVADQ